MFYCVKNKHNYKWKTPLFALKGYLLKQYNDFYVFITLSYPATCI